MGSMHTGLEELPDGYDRMAAFYAERARGGVGLHRHRRHRPQRKAGLPAARCSPRKQIAARHRVITDAVHAADARSPADPAYRPLQPTSSSRCSAPCSALINPSSRLRSARPIFTRPLPTSPAAPHWQQAGVDGVEVMGSEGYLINQFCVQCTNQRTDEWGGPFANRMRFAVETVKAVRAAVGTGFIIIYRLSMSTWSMKARVGRSGHVATSKRPAPP